MSSIDINKLSCGSSGYIEQVIESVKNQFWKDVLYAWKSVIEKDENKRLDKLSCQYSLVE
jgi:hypothetical protein